MFEPSRHPPDAQVVLEYSRPPQRPRNEFPLLAAQLILLPFMIGGILWVVGLLICFVCDPFGSFSR